MVNLILDAVPVFLLLTVVEGLSFWLLPPDLDPGIAGAASGARGYGRRDTATNIGMGLGNLAVETVWRAGLVAVYAVLYTLSPWRLSSHDWRTWVALFLLDDLCYYGFHRAHHEIRLLWASHITHHSSEHYNLSTAVRQTWTPMTGLPFWVVLPILGFAPWMVLLEQSVSLIYQFWIHTERIDRLGPLEWVFNTPSHHRVHHASDKVYLDRNYGGILIIWDRLFGSFQDEGVRPTYGLTKPLTTNKLWQVAFHEYVAIGRDVRAARGLGQALRYLLGRPGWSPTPPGAPALAAGPLPVTT